MGSERRADAAGQLKRGAGRLAGAAVLVAGLCALLLPVASRFVYTQRYVDTDFFNFWLAAHLVVTGQSPYAPEAWAAAHQLYQTTWTSEATFLYPLPLALLLAPLGWLALDQAYVAWVAISFVLVVAAGLLFLLQPGGARLKHYIVPVTAGLLLFRSLWIILFGGQVAALWLICLSLAACLWEDKRWGAGGVLIAVIALKPTLGAPLLGVVALWLIASRHWRALAGMGLAAALLALSSLAVDPAWIGKFLGAGQAKLTETFGHTASLWGMVGATCQYYAPCTVGLGGLLAGGLVLAVCTALVRTPHRYGPADVICLSIPVALLITPYSWPYDQILLVLPIIWVTLWLMRSGAPYLVGALFFLVVDIGAIALLLVAVREGADTWSGLIPILVGAALWGAIAAAHKHSGTTLSNAKAAFAAVDRAEGR